MHYLPTQITPEEATDIQQVAQALLRQLEAKPTEELTYHEELLLAQAKRALRWSAYVRHQLYDAWAQLPDGDHLKDVYRDEVWTWNDEDIAAPRLDEDNRPTLADIDTSALRRRAAELKQGFRRPTPDELADG